MLKLYEIPEIFNNFIALCDDPNADLADMEQALQTIEGEFAQKMENCAKLYKNQDHEAICIDEEIKRLTQRKKTLESKNKWLKGYMLAQMEKMGKDKLRGTLFNFSRVRNQPAVIIHSLDKIPAEYQRVIPEKREADKTAIKEAILSGQLIDGAELQYTYRLQF